MSSQKWSKASLAGGAGALPLRAQTAQEKDKVSDDRLEAALDRVGNRQSR